MIVPDVPRLGALMSELPPVRPNRVLNQLLLKRSHVRLRIDKVEKARRYIKRVSGAHDSSLSIKLGLKVELKWEMTFLNPAPIIDDAFALKAAQLECHVRMVLQDHIAASGHARDVLKILTHETVATARISSIDDRALLVGFSCRVTRLWAEEMMSNLLIPVKVLRA